MLSLLQSTMFLRQVEQKEAAVKEASCWATVTITNGSDMIAWQEQDLRNVLQTRQTASTLQHPQIVGLLM